MNDKILEFTYRPIADKKKAFPLLFVLLGVSLSLVILSMQINLYKGVISLLAMVGIIASTYIYVKYISSEYIYSVMINDNDEAMFLINKVIGKRSSLMCSFYLCDVISVQKFTKETKKEYVADPRANKYNFIVTFMKDDFYLVKTSSPLAKCEIKLECSDEVAKRILDYAALSKTEEE